MNLRPFFTAVLPGLLGAASFLSPIAASAQASATGQWANAMNFPAVPIHHSLLPNGKVLMWGRDEVQRLWDPVTQGISLAPNPGYDLFCGGHTLLPDGRVLIAGGHIADFVGYAKASVYNPATNTWTAAPGMNAGRWYPTVTTLPNGDALVVSGEIDTVVGMNTLPQVYQAATNTWRDLTNAQVSQAMYPMMFVAPNGKVIEVAPTHVTRWLDTTGTGTWSTVGLRKYGWRDYGSAVMYADGKILVMGGDSPPTATAEVIDLNVAAPAWRSVASMTVARRYHNSTLLPDGTVLVTGGTYDGTNPVYRTELWNPVTETWTTLANATVPRMYHSSALLLPDGRVLTTGGDYHPAIEIFSPPYLFKGARPAMSAVPASIGYGQRFTVQSPDAAGIEKVTLIRVPSVTHGFDQNQRLNVLQFTPGTGTVDITAPANANLAPPGHYQLFIVNGNGVPSVGSVVQLGATGGPAPPPPAPGPALNSMAPSNATAGGPAFTLTVNGSNFVSGATVRWNGTARSTTFVSASQLTAAIAAADIAAAGTAQVTVANPDATASGALTFTVAAAPGTCSYPAWVRGSQYAAGAIVSYNGSLYIAKFANPGYNPTISTYYWAPYQCGSTPPPAPAPALTSISPGNATAGGPAFTLTVNGSNFVSGAAVRWNGAPRATTFISASQLTAAIAAADIAAAGTAQVTVANPDATASGALTFTVAAAPGTCSYPAWVQGRQYAAGAIVSYNGSLYIAKFANPGYNPTISTYYWAPYTC